MIYFKDWHLRACGVLAQQYDNLTRRLDVEGDFPAGWRWEALVEVGSYLDILTLYPTGTGIGTDLTRERLAVAGYYTIQLRGTRGEEVRHTDKTRVYVAESLSGDAVWPEIPSEFTQLEQRVNEAAERYPNIGENGNWYVYSPPTGTWMDTGESAQGPVGPAYTLTEADKNELVAGVLAALPTWEGGSY